MFHKAIDLHFKEGTVMEVTFQDGVVKRYDMQVLFPKYPQLEALRDRDLFTSGKLMGAYGIYWNDACKTSGVYNSIAGIEDALAGIVMLAVCIGHVLLAAECYGHNAR